MFKLTKILNSKISEVEPFELDLDGAGELDILANCIYHYSEKKLVSPLEVKKPHLFIPIKNYEKTATKVLGYFISADMIFEVNYVDYFGNGINGDDFELTHSNGNGSGTICDAVSILDHADTGIGFVVYMSPDRQGNVLVKFKI